jgi:hypothetical protein
LCLSSDFIECESARGRVRAENQPQSGENHPANFFVAESLFAFACLRGFDLFEILVLKTNALRRKCAQNMPFTVEPERHQHHQGLKPVIGQTADIFQLRQDSF